MTGTIFDLIEENLPSGKEGYLELAKKAPQPKDNSFLNDVKDYAKTFLKGSVEGTVKLGQLMSGNSSQPVEEGKKDISEVLDELLPTDEGFTQRSIRRGLKEAPTALSFPGSAIQTLPRAIAAGFLGESAKELGAPEWAQTAAELTAYIGPDVTKKLLEKGKNKKLIQFAKKSGISEEALAPLLNSEFKQKWLSKLSPRRGSTQTALSKSKEELGEAYERIKKGPESINKLGEPATEKIIKEIDDSLFEMPSSVREKISRDYSDLISKPISGETLINFYGDINHSLGPSSKQLSLLKEPIKNALKEIAPEIEKDFGMINDLFSRYYKISKRLEPNLMTDLIGASEALGLIGSFTLGYYPTLVKFAGEKAAREVAKQLLINPRFHQLSGKMVEALNQNKFIMAKKVSDLMGKEIEKTSPELSQKIEKISEDDFKELLKKYQHDQ